MPGAKKKIGMKKKPSAEKVKKPFFDPKDPEIKKLLNAKTPAAYIDACVNSTVKAGHKMKITPLWMEKTGYTLEDIAYARNRHPYWKARKMKNNAERNRKRMKEHDYSKGKKKPWTDEELQEFLELNASTRDFELAKHFSRSIPSIQYVRRRISLAKKILEAEGKQRVHEKTLLKFITKDEKTLRNMLNEAVKASKKAAKKK